MISGSAPGTYAENGTAPVAAFTARDPERDGVTWTLAGTDADDFSITNGTLRFSSPPNYESATDDDTDNTYEVTVQASDGSQARTATEEVTIRVLNVDEPGTVTLSTVQPKDGVAVTATLTDPDGDVLPQSQSWRWAQSSSRAGTFTNIRDAESSTFLPGGDNPATTDVVEETSYAGKYLRATVTYKDPQSTRVTKTAFFVSTNPVLKEDYENQAPVFPDQNPDTPGPDNSETTRSIPETAAPGSAVGAPVVATDMGETRLEVLTYTLLDNEDTDSDSNANTPRISDGDSTNFSIDSGTGQIRVGQGLDYETKTTPYTVTGYGHRPWE